MRNLKESVYAVIDMSLVLTIGIAFASMMVIAVIIWTVQGQLWHTPTGADNAYYNTSYSQSMNITGGFDDAVALILVAVTVFILAIAISALLMLRGR